MAIIDEKVYGLKGKQVKDVANRVKNNAGDIAGLETTVAGKQDALSAAQLSAVNSGIDSTKVAQIAANTANISSNSVEIDGINEKIPAQASSSNQLADKDFVNSSVATNTAYYISDNGQPFASLAALEAYSGTVSNNDYAFVVGTDQAGNTTYTRYKYNAESQEWAEEYVLNNSSFTANQWAAINSGITSGDVTKLAGIEAGAEANTIDSISVNGTEVTPVNKNVDLTIGGGIKTLTTADYNYPTTGTKTTIAPWLLDQGIYRAGESINIQAGGTATQVDKTLTKDAVFAIKKSSSYVEYIGYTDYGIPAYFVYNPSGAIATPAMADGAILRRENVNNTLTSSDAYSVLSANQGRILKGLVDTKQDAITMTDTDPGEGAALAAGQFIAVYDGSNS